MELLIPGLVLVALMVYASTRIKRATAKAFEREEIETASFSLIKPEGFLHLLNGDPAFAFQAYSKEFGENGASEKRRATIDIRSFAGGDFDEVCEGIKGSGTLIDAKHFLRDESRASAMEIEPNADDSDTVDHYLIVEAPGSVFEIRTTVLKAYLDTYLRRIDEMEESFSIKK